MENSNTIKESDSQHKQDAFVLQHLNYKTNGFFVDVGAGDPWEISNTWLLETNYGWDGLCIEGGDVFFEKLQQERKCKCVKSYVYTNSNPININITGREGKGYGNYLDGYGKVGSKQQKVIIPRLLMDIFKEENVPKEIDYLSIDIEGAELDILKTIDFDYYTFRIMTVENNHQQETIDFLKSKNYSFITTLGEDSVFIHD